MRVDSGRSPWLGSTWQDSDTSSFVKPRGLRIFGSHDMFHDVVESGNGNKLIQR